MFAERGQFSIDVLEDKKFSRPSTPAPAHLLMHTYGGPTPQLTNPSPWNPTFQPI